VLFYLVLATHTSLASNAKPCKSLTLDDLKSKFQHHTVTATLQCAGNRRRELQRLAEIKGLSWDIGGISNAHWTGVRLCDVLAYCGIDQATVDAEGLKHVQFEGLDRDMTTCYGSSIPISIALDPARDVILAFDMNGDTLPRDHGYPIRVVAPGIVGARNVKWLGRITVSADESPNHWQQRDYKSFPPQIDWSTVDWSKAPAIQDMPIQSAICNWHSGAVHVVDRNADENELDVRGYAWSGGGRNVIRVDVSIDGGKTWNTADMNHGAEQEYNKAWAWTLWKTKVAIPSDLVQHGGDLTIVCRAVDNAYNTQPEKLESVWNLRGVVNNAWHRISITIAHNE
jgi:sulfite oxidase